VQDDLGVEPRVVVTHEGSPTLCGRLELVALGDARSRSQVFDRRVVNGDEAGARTGLDAHIADRHPTFHGEVTYRLTPILDDVARAAAGAEGPDDGERDVLGRDARTHVALECDGHGLSFLLGECLRGEHVLDLAGADAES